MIRAIGLKHGPRILALVFSGIVIGGVVGFGIDAAMTLGDLNAISAEAGPRRAATAEAAGQESRWARS